uniref:Uncharacterized protein n=1 Tax=Cacopsylla melanoneura TaxID=428564 RepID=A0A8D9BLL1_9HEMI
MKPFINIHAILFLPNPFSPFLIFSLPSSSFLSLLIHSLPSSSFLSLPYPLSPFPIFSLPFLIFIFASKKRATTTTKSTRTRSDLSVRFMACDTGNDSLLLLNDYFTR